MPTFSVIACSFIISSRRGIVKQNYSYRSTRSPFCKNIHISAYREPRPVKKGHRMVTFFGMLKSPARSIAWQGIFPLVYLVYPDCVYLAAFALR